MSENLFSESFDKWFEQTRSNLCGDEKDASSSATSSTAKESEHTNSIQVPNKYKNFLGRLHGKRRSHLNFIEKTCKCLIIVEEESIDLSAPETATRHCATIRLTTKIHHNAQQAEQLLEWARHLLLCFLTNHTSKTEEAEFETKVDLARLAQRGVTVRTFKYDFGPGEQFLHVAFRRTLDEYGRVPQFNARLLLK